MKFKLTHFSGSAVVAAVIGLFGIAQVQPAGGAASIRDLSTVFYGKILGTGSAQPFLVTEGELVWTVRRADEIDLTLKATVKSLNDGEFSYRLDVPHEALALGLDASQDTVPLRADEETHSHLEITVNGKPAKIREPGDSIFSVAQAKRGAIYRLDIEVELTAVDTDGDGLPDWWEEKYGTDPQTPDANADLDGDGMTNLQEYLAGTDPGIDSRKPAVLTTDVIAYPGGFSGMALKAMDADSAPDQLIYTLTKTPSMGRLYLRNAVEDRDAPNLPLEMGSAFTQADVHGGRLVFELADGPIVESTTLEVSLRDENPEHEAAVQTISVHPYTPFNGDTPPSAVDALKAKAHALLRNNGYIIWDEMAVAEAMSIAAPSTDLPDEEQSVFILRFGEERGQIILGGAGDDEFTGGMASDFIAGGPGDDRLGGDRGADLFVYHSVDSGHDTIADFSFSEGDVIDLSGVLNGDSSRLDDYVRFWRSANEELELVVDADGNGGGYTDITIRFDGLEDPSWDLDRWVDEGHLLVGDLLPVPRISIGVNRAIASENGPEAGAIQLARSGDLSEPLTVSLAVNGSAVNGTDYAFIENSITFPAGESVVKVNVQPFPDGDTELDETVQLTVMPGEGYKVSPDSVAVIVIEDLKVLIAIEAIEPVAFKDSLFPGAFLIRRSAIIDQSVLVRLDVEGTASRSVDYQSIVRFISLEAGETSAVIEVIPKADAVLEGGAETVRVSIVPDDAYRLGDNAVAQVTLVEREMTFAAWREERFPEATSDLQAFALEDPGAKGIPVLLRYAFGLDALNPHAAGLPRVTSKDGYLTLEANYQPAAVDVEWVIESSSDLQTWTDASAHFRHVVPPPDQPYRLIYRAIAPVGEDSSQYLRLGVARK